MYFVYVLKCCDGSFYTGITNNLEKRLSTHRNGKGSKYVFAHLPVEIVYFEEYKTKNDALKREYEIKKWSRVKKISKLKLPE